MRILITGIDGYLGWPLANHLAERGHEIAGVDAFYRRQWVEEMDSVSAIPIPDFGDRFMAFTDRHSLLFHEGDLTEYGFVDSVLCEFEPDTIVHLGECPSAAYSMRDANRAAWVQINNIWGTLNLLHAMRDVVPNAHLIKLGTMGEYGTPDVDIPEGFFEVEYRGRAATLPFPRQAGSWYHWSKVHDSGNTMFACQTYGLSATDLMQGVVFGTSKVGTRLDFDEAFGTLVNRFCCQAVINHPLTIYGSGKQQRGFLPLTDSLQCLTLAIDNPPEEGEYRVFNQFAHVFSIIGLARLVARTAKKLGLEVEIEHIDNPRTEAEEHYYNPDHKKLLDLGYQPTLDVEKVIRGMLEDLIPHRERIAKYRYVLTPKIRWSGK